MQHPILTLDYLLYVSARCFCSLLSSIFYIWHCVRDPCEALQPKTTFNPALQRFYQCVERRALDPEADISELDPVISK